MGKPIFARRIHEIQGRAGEDDCSLGYQRRETVAPIPRRVPTRCQGTVAHPDPDRKHRLSQNEEPGYGSPIVRRRRHLRRKRDRQALSTNPLFARDQGGQLAYIVSNVSYGMDYPFTKVYISDEFSEKKSMNEVYQLLSRGGRGQMSNLAKIFISAGCAQKILDVNEEGDTLEVNNILTKFKSIL